MLTQELLHHLFDYDATNGNLIWRVKKNRAKPGAVAGNISHGYCRIKINKKHYGAHRLIWLYHFGVMPENDIDHINGNPADNRLENLRLATRAENKQNLRKPRTDNKSGYLGVSKNRKKWIAQIGINGKYHHLGSFDTPELAHEAYLEAKTKLHPFQTLCA